MADVIYMDEYLSKKETRLNLLNRIDDLTVEIRVLESERNRLITLVDQLGHVSVESES